MNARSRVLHYCQEVRNDCVTVSGTHQFSSTYELINYVARNSEGASEPMRLLVINAAGLGWHLRNGRGRGGMEGGAWRRAWRVHAWRAWRCMDEDTDVLAWMTRRHAISSDLCQRAAQCRHDIILHQRLHHDAARVLHVEEALQILRGRTSTSSPRTRVHFRHVRYQTCCECGPRFQTLAVQYRRHCFD